MTRVIIVGSGMAGLTTAAYLAREGCELDVFEQADQIGGVTTTLQSEGFAWDLGPLMVEGFAPGEPVGKILAELGCADRVELVRADRGISFPDYRVFRPSEYLGPYWRREKLKEIFPHEAKGLDRYYRFYDTMLDLMTLDRQADEANRLRALALKLRMALLLRQKSKVLVAYGSCAYEGCIPALSNLTSAEATFNAVFLDNLTTDNPAGIIPQPVTNVPEGELDIPEFYNTVKSLDQVVTVDYYLPGCPPEPPQIWRC